MANKVVITTDTGCDLNAELLEKYHIADMIPLYINMQGKSLTDYHECTPDDIFKCYNDTKQVPKTAAPPPADYIEHFEKFASQGFDIVHISINGGFSSSYANSVLAGDEISRKYGTEFYAVDSHTLTGAQALLAIRAAELADSGMNAKDIAGQITAMTQKVQTDFLLGGMDYAAKGGRCSMLLAFGANLLKLYPMMHIDGAGVITAPKKFRGSLQSVHNQYIDYVLGLAEKNADHSRLIVDYTGMDKPLLDSLLKRVRDYGKFEDVVLCRTNCTVATHGGPNTIALFYVNK
ncbi:MAG: DegV family protein [Firmicutes bacterium]|nr:DegV family protein [Bacillota bacterium]